MTKILPGKPTFSNLKTKSLTALSLENMVDGAAVRRPI